MLFEVGLGEALIAVLAAVLIKTLLKVFQALLISSEILVLSAVVANAVDLTTQAFMLSLLTVSKILLAEGAGELHRVERCLHKRMHLPGQIALLVVGICFTAINADSLILVPVKTGPACAPAAAVSRDPRLLDNF
jgi:hypothetical protein